MITNDLHFSNMVSNTMEDIEINVDDSMELTVSITISYTMLMLVKQFSHFQVHDSKCSVLIT